MRRFIQVIDFDLPHQTGLVFEVERITHDRYWVFDVISEKDGSKLFGGGWLKSCCLELNDFKIEYCEILLKRTELILEFQKDK